MKDQSRKLQWAKLEFLKRKNGWSDSNICECSMPPAVITLDEFDDTQPYCAAMDRFFDVAKPTPEDAESLWNGLIPPHHFELFEKLYLEELLKNSKGIVEYLLKEKTRRKALVAIDLERKTEDILAEIKEIVRCMKSSIALSRLKWLPIVDDLLMVYDLYCAEGKAPGSVTFKMISKKLNKPISTVKSQFYLAYEKIHEVPYAPEVKFSTKEKKIEADKLCTKCPHGAKCYKANDWFPCAEYLQIGGKERRVDHLEYKDALFSGESDIL